LVTWIETDNVQTTTAILSYDNVSTNLVSSNSGKYFNFTTSLLSSTLVLENKSFYFNITNYYIGSNTVVQLDSHNQILNPILFKLCNSTFNISSVNFTVYQEGTSDILESSIDILLNYWIDGDGTTAYHQFNMSDNNENKTTFELCISDETQIFTLDGVANYYRTDSDSRIYLLTDFLATNTTQVIPLYLAATNITDIVTIKIIDDNRNYVEDANVYVQRWDIGTNTFENIAILTTNSNGEAYVNLYLYDVYYRFVVYYDDEIRKTTTPEKLFDIEKEIPITIQTVDNYQPFTNINTQLTFNDDTNVVSYVFVDSSGALSNGCLYIYNMTAEGNILLSSECSESVSSTLSYLVTTNNTYFAKGILTLNSAYNGAKQIDTLVITGKLKLNNDVIGTSGYMISFLLLGTIIVAGIATGMIEISLIGVPIIMLFTNFIGWLNIPTDLLFSVISLCVLFLVLGGLKK
jgi:PBP1b-binding outer membrane lipoprotein LpoB